MASILGLFETAEAAANAAEELGTAGFSQEEWEVLTDSPYPEGAFGEREPHHTLFRFPLMGAMVGFSVALLYTLATQVSYPLVTGGKPLISIPPMIIILYELSMMGALIATFLGIIIESRLPRLGGPGLYDRRITEGYIAIVVDAPSDRVGAADQVFQQSGAMDIKRQE